MNKLVLALPSAYPARPRQVGQITILNEIAAQQYNDSVALIPHFETLHPSASFPKTPTILRRTKI
jgi:hypothetical protein